MSKNPPFVPSLLSHHPNEKAFFVSVPPVRLTGGTPQVIRWCSMPDTTKFKPMDSVDEALVMAKQHKAHLAALEDSGITIPKFSTVIGHEPTMGRLAIYHVVEHIENATHVNNHSNETLRAIGQSLIQYTNWVLETGQPRFLMDICNPNQFSSDNDGSPILIDIEPSYIDTIDPHTGKVEFLLTDTYKQAEHLAGL